VVLNEFASIFNSMALIYFSDKFARRASRVFYEALGKALETAPRHCRDPRQKGHGGKYFNLAAKQTP
jgi:hypothetical protein